MTLLERTVFIEEAFHLRTVLFVGIREDTMRACCADFGGDDHAWEVATAATGPEAFRILGERRVDVLVTDFHTPGLANGQLLAETAKRFPGVARVVVSAQRDIEHIDMVVRCAHQFLAAPCSGWELRDAIERAGALRDVAVFETLRGDTVRPSVLPTPPGSFLDIASVLDDPKSSTRQIAAAVERDVALSVKLLRLANSSFFASPLHIESIEHVVVLMGRAVLRSVLLLDSIGRSIDVEGPLRSWLVEVNQHCWETAALARRLARPAFADDAFCTALLLECGQLALAASRPDLMAEMILQAQREHRSLDELEYEAFGVSHSTVGGFLLSMWGFSEELVDIVVRHADLPVAGSCAPDAGRVVQMAHQIVSGDAPHVCANRHRVDMGDLCEWGALTELAAWKGERHPDRLGRTSVAPSTRMACAIS